MEGKSVFRFSMKIKNIHSNFKNVRKVSFLKETELDNKKKTVMFFEPPKEIKSRINKKTQISINSKLLEKTLQTEIDQSIRKNKKKLKLTKINKSHSISNIIKLPVLKSKIVNTNTYHYMSVIDNLLPKTCIIKNNTLNPKKKESNLKKVNTVEDNKKNNNNDNKKIKNLNLKKIKIVDKKESKKEIINKNIENYLKNNDLKDEKKEEKRNNLLIFNENSQKFNVINEENEPKKGRSLSKCENTYNSGINENKKEEENDEEKEKKFEKEKNIDEINEKNINENLNNKIIIHKQNNSVDSINKKEKKKCDNIIKKFLCCLYG